jgi:hypothetical protein
MKHVLGAVLALVLTVSCSSDDGEDEVSGPPVPKADAQKVCNDMCSETSFAESRVDILENETNCICTGPGTVTVEACQSMCQGINKPTSAPYKTSGAIRVDACQCT